MKHCWSQGSHDQLQQSWIGLLSFAEVAFMWECIGQRWAIYLKVLELQISSNKREYIVQSSTDLIFIIQMLDGSCFENPKVFLYICPCTKTKETAKIPPSIGRIQKIKRYREDIGINFNEPLTVCIYELVICPTDSGPYLTITFQKKILYLGRG